MTENDVGMRVVGFVHRLLEIDAEWTREEERGFTWWPATFAQRVWADPPNEDDGTTLCRVHVQTDLWRASPERPAVPPFDPTGMSGVIAADDDPSLFRLASSFYVHDLTEAAISRLVALTAAVQAAWAYHAAPAQVSESGGTVPASAPPGGRPRPLPDDMVSVIQRQVVPAGEGGSAFVGPEFEQAAEWLEARGFVTTADESGLTAELPFGEFTALLTLKADDPHPIFGHGLTGRLRLPVPAGDDATTMALELNRAEVHENTNAHFFGTWYYSGESVTPTLEFRLFLPNLVGGPGWVTNFALSMAVRAEWASVTLGDSSAGEGSEVNPYADPAGLDDESFNDILDALPPGEDREQAILSLTALRAAMRADAGGG